MCYRSSLSHIFFKIDVLKNLLPFHVWLQNKGKILVCSKYYNQFGIYQPVQKGVLKNFANFTGLKACNCIKKETPIQVFSCEIYEISKNTYFEEHLQTIASLNDGSFDGSN